MDVSIKSQKRAKFVGRIVEVLDYFYQENPELRVRDIVNRYGRPQSSTTELLFSMVELGLLHRNPVQRTFSLTPCAGLIGTSAQTGMVRDGRLVLAIDRLAAQTGLEVVLFGLTELNAQVVRWNSRPRATGKGTRTLYCGMRVPLIDSAAGWLLLSTFPSPRREAVVRRLISENDSDSKANFAEICARLHKCSDEAAVIGPAGFGMPADLVALLLPDQPVDQPLALALIHDPKDQHDPIELLACLRHAVARIQEEHLRTRTDNAEALPLAIRSN